MSLSGFIVTTLFLLRMMWDDKMHDLGELRWMTWELWLSVSYSRPDHLSEGGSSALGDPGSLNPDDVSDCMSGADCIDGWGFLMGWLKISSCYSERTWNLKLMTCIFLEFPINSFGLWPLVTEILERGTAFKGGLVIVV